MTVWKVKSGKWKRVESERKFRKRRRSEAPEREEVSERAGVGVRLKKDICNRLHRKEALDNFHLM